MTQSEIMMRLKQAIKAAHHKAQQSRNREKYNDFLVFEYEELIKRIGANAQPAGGGNPMTLDDFTQRIEDIKVEEGLIVK